MRITFSETQNQKSDTALIFKFAGQKLAVQGQGLDEKSLGFISKALQEASSFTAKFGQNLVVHLPAETGYVRAIIFGLGDQDDFDSKKFLEAGGRSYSALKASCAKKVDVFLSRDGLPVGCEETDVSMLFAEGAALKAYSFDQYKTKSTSTSSQVDILNVVNAAAKDNLAAYKAIKARVEAVHLARDLTAEPANMLYPENYAKRIEEDLKPIGVKVTVFDEKKLLKMGAGALMAVGQGSARQPRLVIMEYNGLGKKSTKPSIGLAGKGVTFDTGGYNIKSDSPMFGIYDMKFDMAGSAAVVGAMQALAKRKAKIHIVAAVALAENSISSTAFLPSDVIKSLSGQTIEITNTDAEGRLVLCDAIWYLQDKYQVDTIVDLATLTGSVIVSLGLEYAGIFTDEDTLWAQIESAGKDSQEKVWRMPMDPAWEKDVDSDIADMKNRTTSGAAAASSKAAQFLRRFVKSGVKWMHIDLAGPVWSKSDTALSKKGATGYGVRLLDTLLAQHYEK